MFFSIFFFFQVLVLFDLIVIPYYLIFIFSVMASSAIANIVKSSLGPVGLDKMLVDESGEVVITNDGATILKQLSVEHPAAKVCPSRPLMT